MKSALSVTISPEEFRTMSEKLQLPAGDPRIEEALREKVEGWYQQMLPFIARMADHKNDPIAPAIVTRVR